MFQGAASLGAVAIEAAAKGAAAAAQHPPQQSYITPTLWVLIILASIILPILGAIVTLIVKQTPKLREIDNTHEISIAAGLRLDIEGIKNSHHIAMRQMGERVATLENKLEASERNERTLQEENNRKDMMLSQTIAAVTILTGALRRIAPDDPALQTANDLITTALTGDSGYSRGLEKIASRPVIRSDRTVGPEE